MLHFLYWFSLMRFVKVNINKEVYSWLADVDVQCWCVNRVCFLSCVCRFRVKEWLIKTCPAVGSVQSVSKALLTQRYTTFSSTHWYAHMLNTQLQTLSLLHSVHHAGRSHTLGSSVLKLMGIVCLLSVCVSFCDSFCLVWFFLLVALLFPFNFYSFNCVSHQAAMNRWLQATSSTSVPTAPWSSGWALGPLLQ